jgi:NADH-quinone oxidoreductase subunit L
MAWIVKNLWLIPALPILAAGLGAVLPQRRRTPAAVLAIGAMGLAFLLSLCAFAHTLQRGPGADGEREFFNFFWFQFGDPAAPGRQAAVWLGWVLDPLAAVMLVMVAFVGLCIFVYSVGYMAHDENFTRFFCFLSLFAGAMLGVVIANSLLLLFIGWELVGLTSYLLIGFWYHKPSAAAAAKKAFITTRIGDVALLLGMVWLYSRCGTLLFYDHGDGCLEKAALLGMAARTTGLGITVAAAIGLLIFAGAMGKSGQVPLHVWLPDAMEGPTPVSALIHAATMVAAGVFLIARVYPLMGMPALSPDDFPLRPEEMIVGVDHATVALQAVVWIGAITAFFAASIAVAQSDIKRILAYSTVSQLGYMMMGLGAGGVAVGIFHLITHAFFKALLFLGAGSVIHGCHEEQDIRRMGGLRRYMPVTFATYAVGMLALAGFPLLFSGFWSKDEILHAAHGWSASHWPFYLGAAGALLTAFYMTRQVCYVFFGPNRAGAALKAGSGAAGHDASAAAPTHSGKVPDSTAGARPHESPGTLTAPLVVLALFSIGLGFLGTPAWPWFQSFLEGQAATVDFGRFGAEGLAPLMAVSSAIVLLGIGLGWWFYGRRPVRTADQPDALEVLRPDIFSLLRDKYYVDEFYEATVVQWNAAWARLCDWLDRWVWNGVVQLVSLAVFLLSWLDRLCDEQVVNRGFDDACRRLAGGGRLMSRLQAGRVQSYLRVIGVALAALVLLLIWGCRAP